MTSDTPRTDALLECVDGDAYLIEPTRLADHARQLERELAEAHRVIAWLRDYMQPCWHASDADGKRAVHVTNADDMHEHLASSPPPQWKTP